MERNLIPDRPHINLWRNHIRRSDPKELREWQNEVESVKSDAERDVDDPTDTIIICNAMLIAANEELEFQRRGRG